MTVVGYVYDADHHCTDCTKEYIKKYHRIDGRAPSEEFLDDFFTGAVEVEDSEGNPIHVMFDTEETDYPVHCSDCGEYLETAWTDVAVEMVVESLRDYLVSWKYPGNPKILDIWASELSYAVPDSTSEVILDLYNEKRKNENAS